MALSRRATARARLADDPADAARVRRDPLSFARGAARRTRRVAITLNAYRSRFLADEPRDPRYDALAGRLAEIERIATPTLMIQGADDRCDEPSSSEGQERFFTGGYRRLLLDGVGHFPHREAPAEVAAAIDRHLRAS